MEYPESINDFLSNNLTEEELIKKIGNNRLPAIETLLLNPLLFSRLLIKIRNTGNRRRVLMQSLPIKRGDLERLLQSGSSLVTDLMRPSTRQIRPWAIAKFGIIYRTPFSWSARECPGEGMDYHNFDHLDGCFLSSSSKLVELLSLQVDEWSIDGYQLKLKGSDSIYLRMDRRPNLIILDLINPTIDNLTIVIDALSKTGYQWWFQQMPSLVVGHSFFIFFGTRNEEVVRKVVKEELPLIRQLINISAVYGGK